MVSNHYSSLYVFVGSPSSEFKFPYPFLIKTQAQDLLGMCAISKSAKKDKALVSASHNEHLPGVGRKADRTGRKGIGFKSVFAAGPQAASFSSAILSLSKFLWRFGMPQTKIDHCAVFRSLLAPMSSAVGRAQETAVIKGSELCRALSISKSFRK